MKNSLFLPLANLKLANFEVQIACIRLPVNWDSPGAIPFTAHDYQTHSTPLTDKVTLPLTQNWQHILKEDLPYYIYYNTVKGWYNKEWETSKHLSFWLTFFSLTTKSNSLSFNHGSTNCPTNKYTVLKFTCSSLWCTRCNELQKKDCTRELLLFPKKTKAIIWWDVTTSNFFTSFKFASALLCYLIS